MTAGGVQARAAGARQSVGSAELVGSLEGKLFATLASCSHRFTTISHDRFDPFNVGSILKPTGGALILQQISPIENWSRQAIEHSGSAIRPSGFKCYRGDRSQDIDSFRRDAEHEHGVRISQIRGPFYPPFGNAKLSQGIPNAICILCRGAYPKIEIARCTRVAVSSKCVSADDKIVSPCVVQRG